MRINTFTRIIAFICFAFVTYGCDFSLHHNLQFHEVNLSSGWERQNELEFHVHILDTGAYNVALLVRYENHYPFQGLSLSASFGSDSTVVIRSDTLDVLFIDDSQQNIGQGGVGGRTIQHPICSGIINMPDTGWFRFRVKHIMPLETLRGINKIGVILNKKE